MEEESHSIDSDSMLMSSIQTFSLEEQNEQLKREVVSLKVQFEDAIRIHSTIDKINGENEKLTKQVLDLKNEKEEMMRRLEIIAKANADLTESLENQKKHYTEHLQSESTNIQSEKNKVAKTFQAEIDSLHDQLDSLNTANNELKLSQKVISSQIQRALEAAGFYFKLTFSNLDDVISLFQTEQYYKPPENNCNASDENKNTNANAQANNNNNLEISENKIKALKKKLKIRTNEYNNVVDDLTRLQASHKREISNYQSQIDRLKKELNEKNHKTNELNEKNLDLQSTISRLNQEVNSTRDTISSLKLQNNELKFSNKSQTALLNQSVASLSDSIAETKKDAKKDIETKKLINDKSILKDEISKLNDKITEYKQRLTSADLKNKSLEEQLRSKGDQLQKEQIQYQKLENDLNAIKIIQAETKSENDALRKSLHDKCDNTNKFKEQKQLLLDQHSKIIEKKDDEIAQLHLEIKQSELRSTEQSLKVVELNSQVANLEDELQKLKTTYNDYVVKMEGIHIPTAEEILPPSAFKTNYFEAPLSQDIMKIALNSALQPNSKIDFIFRTISTFYNKKLSQLDESCQHYIKDENTIRSKINQFIIDISIALNDQNPMTFDDLFNPNNDKCQECCSLIINLITDCKTKFLSVSRERDQLIAILTSIGQVVGFNNLNGNSSGFNDIISFINEFKNQIISLQNNCQQLTKKYKLCYSETKAVMKKLKANDIKYKKEISALQVKNSDLEKMVIEKADHLSRLKKENKQLQSNIRTVHADLPDISETQLLRRENISIDSNEEVETMKEKFTKAIESYKIHIQQLQKKNEELTQQIQNLENELSKSQQIISSQRSSNEILTRENNDLTQQNTQIESALSSKYEIAKRNLQQSFDQTIEQLKQQNENSRNDIQKIMKQTKIKDDKIKELNLNIKALINEKNKLANETNAIREQLDREKLISDASIKTQILTIESKYKEQMDQQIARDEAELRSIIMYAVNAFRAIVSPASTMGVSASSNDNIKLYKNLIEKIKDIVTKLSESDQAIRKMLCAYNNQTTQDAVAQLLYNFNDIN